MKNLVLLLCCLLWSSPCKAQSEVGINIDDLGKLIIGVNIKENCNKETQKFREVLTRRLEQFITQSGFSSNSNYRFYVQPQLIIDSDDVAEGGMKNVHVLKGHLYLTLQDESAIYSSISLPFKGSGTQDEKALKNAINNIQLNDVRTLFETGKEKIYSFYRSRKDIIFGQADRCVLDGNYDEAITCLMVIPEEITDLYSLALQRASEILELKNQHEEEITAQELYENNEAILTNANSLVASNQPIEALNVLSEFRQGDPEQNRLYAQLVAKAESQVSKNEAITRKDILRKEKRDYNIALYNNQVNSQRIEAMKTIALEYLKNHPTYRYYIYY